jgi:hypothetical protein
MAHLVFEKTSKRWRVCWVEDDGRRPSLRIGKLSEPGARKILTFIEDLLAARVIGTLSPATSAWMNTLTDKLHAPSSRDTA